jgi:hypothetical protein
MTGNSYGVWLMGSQSSGNKIQGNIVGTNAAGNVNLSIDAYGVTGSESWGIFVYGGSNNLVGGSEPGARNLVSGQTYGIIIMVVGANGNHIEGNYVGTDVAGMQVVGGRYGVFVQDGDQSVVGGTTAGARNIISGNYHGLLMYHATKTLVQGNYIGVGADGVTPLPNTDQGIVIIESQNSMIGGTTPGAGNLIAHNGEHGVATLYASSSGNHVQGNSIHHNGEEGIKNEMGGNKSLAAPVIVSAAGNAASGTGCPLCSIDLYSDSADQGQKYEGMTTANGAGAWAMSGSFSGPRLTATVTDASGNTSEFSAAIAIGTPAAPEPTPTSPTQSPAPTPVPNVLAPQQAPRSPVIPQVFQNPGLLAQLQPSRVNTPVPQAPIPSAQSTPIAATTSRPQPPLVISPPRTGDAGLIASPSLQ